MRAATMLVAVAALLPGVSPAVVTSGDCQRHRDEFVASLEDNRKKSVREIDEAWRDTRDSQQRALLEEQRNQAWEFEERMRATGDQIFRDCMAHVADTKPGG